MRILEAFYSTLLQATAIGLEQLPPSAGTRLSLVISISGEKFVAQADQRDVLVEVRKPSLGPGAWGLAV